MSSVTDYPDWSPHVATAQQIAVTGVPLLAAPATVLNTTKVIAGGGSYASGLLAMPQIGYEFELLLNTTSSATQPFAELILEWTDQGTGLSSGHTAWYCPASSAVASWVLAGHGPNRGNQVAVTVNNDDPSISLTAGIRLVTNSRVYDKDMVSGDNITNTLTTIPGFTLPSLPDDNSILGFLSSQSVPAASSKQWLFSPAPRRPVHFAGVTSGITPASVQVQVQGKYQGQLGGGSILLNQVLTTAGYAFDFTCHGGVMLLTVFNNATSGTLSFGGMMVAQD